MKLAMKMFSIFAMILSLCIISFAQTNWLGEYQFGEDGGETAGGSKIYIAHTIKITEKNGKLDAHIYSQGFQTSRDIYADVKTIDDKIEFYYRDKGEDQNSSQYKKGDLLLTIERKIVNDKIELFTYWSKFKPVIDENIKSGEVYFTNEDTAQNVFSKEKDWTRIIVEEDEFSYAMPSDFLVYKKRHKPIGIKGKYPFLFRIRLFWQIAYENGVQIELKEYLVNQTNKTKLKNNSVKRKFKAFYNDSALGFFKEGDYYVLAFKPQVSESGGVSQKIYIGKSKTFYQFTITADTFSKKQVKKFLTSIKINGKNIFRPKNPAENTMTINSSNEKVVRKSKLKTSGKIKNSLNVRNNALKIDKKLKPLDQISSLKKENYSSPLIILFPSERPLSIKSEKMVKLRIKLLANNQIGNITVYSNADEEMIKRALEIAKKIQFVPAEKNGKPIDSIYEMQFNFPRLLESII